MAGKSERSWPAHEHVPLAQMSIRERAGLLDNVWKMLDRTAVLLIGVGVGAAISHGFLKEGASGAQAQASPAAFAVAKPDQKIDCGERLSPRIVQALRTGRKIEIGVFGDSFGDGLWAALYNQLRPVKSLEVHRFAKQSTGFTRYQSLNLFDDIKGKTAAQPVDIAVISFGANDTQDILANGKLAPFMGPAWQKEIGARADAVVQLLQSQGAMVYWVGLPKMREAKFDSQVQAMNTFYEERMCKNGVPFINSLPVSVDAKGAYTLFLKDPKTGEEIKARAGDGIHMTMTGYGFLTQGLADRFRTYGGSDSATIAPKKKLAAGTPVGGGG